MQTRPIVDMFNHSYGLYDDVWSAWAEGIINICVTIFVALKWGLIGILLGKIVSLFLIVVLWKPYYLFTHGFKEALSCYWKGILRYYFCFVISAAYFVFTIIIFNNYPSPTLPSMILFELSEVLPTIILFSVLLYFLAPGTKDLFNRIPFHIHK
jgi:hypothetical protein